MGKGVQILLHKRGQPWTEKVSNKKDVEPARGKGYPNCTAQKLQTDPCLIMKELKEAFSYVSLVLQWEELALRNQETKRRSKKGWLNLRHPNPNTKGFSWCKKRTDIWWSELWPNSVTDLCDLEQIFTFQNLNFHLFKTRGWNKLSKAI